MDNEYGDRLLWFLAGATLGATVALLFAPHPGQHTRRLLARQARKGRQLLEDQGGDLLEKGRDLYRQGRRVADEAGDLIDRGRRIVEG